MKTRQIFIALCLLIGITFGGNTAIAQNAYNPYEAFDRDSHSIYIQAAHSPLMGNTKPEYMIPIPVVGFSAGYNYMHSINNFYSIGIGGVIGRLKYRVTPPREYDQYFLYSDLKKIHVSIPVFVNKYFPFSHRLAMVVKAGVNLNSVLAVDSRTGVTIDDQRIYRIYIDVRQAPQLGVLFELGWAYSFRNYNSLSVNFVVNKNFAQTIKMNYEYFEDDPDNPLTGSMSSTASSFGVSLRYNFKTKSDEEK